MQSNNLKQQLNKAKELSYLLALQAADKYPGEAFHSDYKKYPAIFRKLIQSDTKLNNGMRTYFKGLILRVQYKINWAAYNSEMMKASVADFIDSDWSDEELTLSVVITDSLRSAILAGGQMTEEEKNINIGWNADSAPAMDFLSKYSIKLAGDLTDTTIGNVQSSLQLSLSNGLSQNQATDALDTVIDNPYRASMIAHTESVRAFSQGRLAVAGEVGADRKEWSATGGACEICEPLDGQIVALDDEFDDGSDAPPAHPNCRCIIRVLMPNETSSSDSSDDSSDSEE